MADRPSHRNGRAAGEEAIQEEPEGGQGENAHDAEEYDPDYS